jgi:hypothetical protein
MTTNTNKSAPKPPSMNGTSERCPACFSDGESLSSCICSDYERNASAATIIFSDIPEPSTISTSHSSTAFSYPQPRNISSQTLKSPLFLRKIKIRAIL